jgi:hypothetical protein
VMNQALAINLLSIFTNDLHESMLITYLDDMNTWLTNLDWNNVI